MARRKYEKRARADREAETRRRIVEATLALHGEVGPARTTVSEVARRAGVQRVTVYAHFPQERDLLGACQGLFLATRPPPDVEPLLAAPDPAERLRAVLVAFYGWYRANEEVNAHVLRDAETVPALGALLAEEAEREAGLVTLLAGGFGARERPVAAAVGLALDFWAWRRLARSGLDDGEAAALMVAAVRAAADG